MVEFTILTVIGLVWLADRAETRRRMQALEGQLRELQQAFDAAHTVASNSPPPAATPEPANPVQAASVARPPPPPRDDVDSTPAAVRFVREFFSSGHLIVRLGIVILFIGVAFLLGYVAQHSHLTIEDRFIGIAIGGIALLILGWLWRERRRDYALALQGGGVGVLYLTVFFALKPYALLSTGAAFALLVAIGALAAVIAILLDSMAFAVLAAIGGFLAPVLASHGDGDYITLFSYYALLDLSIVAIAWYRSWRVLNLVAFLFTYGIGTAWGVLRYRPENFAGAEPFLVVFFAMFLCIALLFALARAQSRNPYVDAALVFGTPSATMALQAGMLHQHPYALAYSALSLSAIYLLLAWALNKRTVNPVRLLVESFIALCVAFATLAIPLALEGSWTGAAWALEGAAAVWIGLRQDRRLAVVAGIALQPGAGLAFFHHLAEMHSAHAGLAALMISVGGLVCAARMRDAQAAPAWLASSRQALDGTLFIWAVGWWVFAGSLEIDRDVPAIYQFHSLLAFIAVTAKLLSLLGARLRWSMPRAAALCLIPVLIVFALTRGLPGHPFADLGWCIWPLSFVVTYWILRRDEAVAAAGTQTLLHALALWLVTAVLTSEIAWQTARFLPGNDTWSQAVIGLIPAIAVLIALAGTRGSRWPFASQRSAYAGSAVWGLAAYLIIWGLYFDFNSDGTASPLSYLPMLNPMDLSQALAILALVNTAHLFGTDTYRPKSIAAIRAGNLIVAFAAFGWLNAMMFRTLHHYADIPYDLDSMGRSTLAQTCVTIFWTSLALIAMVWANRAARRVAWLAGAVLLGIVVMKLFLIDLSRTGTLPRIVSFLGVGVLMLVIGYFSPLPPKSTSDG